MRIAGRVVPASISIPDFLVGALCACFQAEHWLRLIGAICAAFSQAAGDWSGPPKSLISLPFDHNVRF